MLSKKVKDITGEKFGSLTVLKYVGNSPGKAKIALWLCRCDCGVEKTFYGTVLRSGGTSSCGCESSEKISQARKSHGMSKSATFNTWKAMKGRCLNPSNPDFHLYGARGVTVCDRWVDSFTAFVEDMGIRPDGMSLDRIDPNKDYEKDNCRWASSFDQANNKRNSRFVEFEGRKITIAQLAKMIGVKYRYLYNKIDKYEGSIDEFIDEFIKENGFSRVEEG